MAFQRQIAPGGVAPLPGDLPLGIGHFLRRTVDVGVEVIDLSGLLRNPVHLRQATFAATAGKPGKPGPVFIEPNQEGTTGF